MLTNIAFLLLICSGSVYCAARNQRRFEEILPLTSIAMVLIVFVCGVCGNLVAGVVIILVLAIALYILSVIHLIRNRQIKGFISAMVTPGAAVFVISFFAVSYLNFGRMAHAWDEFSHWVDIVKVMATLDDFGTNAMSFSTFASYPPGMSIFQYILQKLTVWINPENTFSEWRVYVAFQTFCILSVMPIFTMCTFRRPLHLLLTCAAVFLTPLLFFGNLYGAVYIDPFLGLVSGTGLALVLICNKKDWVYHGNIWAFCAILVLAKDVGIMFAIILMIAYIADLFWRADLQGRNRGFWKKAGLSLGALSSCILPKLLWKLELSLSGAAINFSKGTDFSILLDLLLGKDETYRDTVLTNYVYSQFEGKITLGHTTLTLSYYVFFLLLVCLLTFLTMKYAKWEPEKRHTVIVVAVAAVAQMLIYIIGLLVIYIFKFSQYEAVQLASLSRYLNMVYLSTWIVAMVLICYVTRYWISATAVEACLICIVMAVSPVENVVDFFNGSSIEEAIAIREKYQPIEELIHTFCDGDDRIFFISQDDNGYDYWVSRFNARPNTFNPNFTWGLGETAYMGGMYAVPMTAEEWMQELQTAYDYVALYKLNDYFKAHYASLFENPDDISSNSLYRIDKDLGLLIKCE